MIDFMDRLSSNTGITARTSAGAFEAAEDKIVSLLESRNSREVQRYATN